MPRRYSPVYARQDLDRAEDRLRRPSDPQDPEQAIEDLLGISKALVEEVERLTKVVQWFKVKADDALA